MTAASIRSSRSAPLGALLRLRALACNALAAVAGVAVLAMVALACANIAGRVFDHPVEGSYELMGFFGAVAAAFSLGYSQLAKGHIAVNILDERIPPKIRRALDAVSALLSAAFFAAAGYEVIDLGNFMVSTGELSETLRMPYYPFVWAVGGGCLVMALVLLVDFLTVLCPAAGSGSGGRADCGAGAPHAEARS
ncbi:Tripartite ATP-independent periplasmic transporter DctQ component [Desulfovibrio sp. X2]|uniref:TRAP transporter small permease n=1 Tax=Desulfovibrio sp. X2 TaxID=941449 RepID=UPI0003588AF8|nr:TRAP transporter small permease [Desulfovibrio sp. X2]EPR41100.1 Tripartite ATP-independent periplasmic transporter DctQ component [Desulfovibrio sp. X2]